MATKGFEILNDLFVFGAITSRDKLNLGTTSGFAGTNYDIEVVGTQTNIDIKLTSKGTGQLLGKVGYVPTATESLINKGYADSKIAGKNINALVSAPGAGQNGYAITWNNGASEYTLTAVAVGLTADEGITIASNVIQLGGVIDANTLTDVQMRTGNGTLHIRSKYNNEADEAGLTVSNTNASNTNKAKFFSAAGNIEFSNTATIITAPTTGAFKYAADYSANFGTRSLPDVDWVNKHIGGKNVDSNITAPGGPQDGYVISWNNAGTKYQLIAAPGGTLAIGSPVGSSTIGSVLFVSTTNTLQQDNANFFWAETNQRLGIHTNTPTAFLHIGAGSTTVPAFKLTTGSQLTTITGAVQNGAFEFDGTHLYIIIGSTRYQLDQQSGGGGGHIIKNNGSTLPNRANLNFLNGLTAADASPDTTVKLGGALVNDTSITGAFDFGVSVTGPTSFITFLATDGSNNSYMEFGPTGFGASGTSATGTTLLLIQATSTTISSTTPGFKGVEYGSDFSASYSIRSLIDKGYADGAYWKLVSGGIFTGPNTLIGTTTNTLKFRFNALTNVQTNGAGVWLANETAAAAGAGNQQWSPSLVLEGQYWDTSSVSSKSVRWVQYNVAVEGSTTSGGGTWTLAQSRNGVAYQIQFSIDHLGDSKFFDNAGAERLRVIGQASGLARIVPNASVSASTYFGTSGTAGTQSSTIAHGLAFHTLGNTATGGAGGLFNFGSNGFSASTTGTHRIFSISPSSDAVTYANTSTSADYIALDITPVINVSGGTHIITGLKYDPVTTSTTGTTHYAIWTTSGGILLAGSLLTQDAAATITASTKLDVRGISSGNIARFADNANAPIFTFLNDGHIQIGASASNFIAPTLGNTVVDVTGTNLLIQTAGPLTAQNRDGLTYVPGTHSSTSSGSQTAFRISSFTMQAGSGSNNFYVYRSNVAFNQSGSATGELAMMLWETRHQAIRGETYGLVWRSTTTDFGSVIGNAGGTYGYTGISLENTFNQSAGSVGAVIGYSFKPNGALIAGTLTGFSHNPTGVTTISGLHYSFRSTSGSVEFTQGAKTSNWSSAIKSTAGAHTGLTLSTEFVSNDYIGATQQWATGALTTQRFTYYRGYTIAFVGASTVTDIYTMYIDASTAGTNATITNNWALGINGNTRITEVLSVGNTVLLGASTLAEFNHTSKAIKILGLSSTGLAQIASPTSGMIAMDGTTSPMTFHWYSGTAWTQVGGLNIVASWTSKQTFTPNATNASLNFGSLAGDPSTTVNGDVWYNSTTNKFRGKENGSNVDLRSAGGGISNIASIDEIMKSDGTNAVHSGVFSTSNGLLDAQFNDATTNTIIQQLKLTRNTSGTAGVGIGNSILSKIENASGTLVNAGEILWISTNVTGGAETFDVSFKLIAGGSTGEVARFNSQGDLILGDGFNIGGSNLKAGSTGSNSGLNILSKGTGAIQILTPGTGTIYLYSGNTNGRGFTIDDSSGVTLVTAYRSSGTGAGVDFLLRPGAGTGTNNDGGNLYLNYGIKIGSGKDGNVGLLTGNVSNWQSMERGLFIADSAAAPTGNPSSGAFLWIDSTTHTLKLRVPAGTVYDLTDGGAGGGLTFQQGLAISTLRL